MDQQKRLLLAIALSFGLTLLFTNLVWKPQAEAEAQAARAAALRDAGVVRLESDGGLAQVAPSAQAQVEAQAAPTPSEGVAQTALPQREVRVERPSSTYIFSSEGAGLVSAELKGPRERELVSLSIEQGYQKLLGRQFDPPPQMNLARPLPVLGPQLSVAIDGASAMPATQRYSVEEEGTGRLVFRAQNGPWRVTKTYSWADAPPAESDPSSYLISLDVEVENTGEKSETGELVLGVNRGIDPAAEEAPSMFGGIGNQATVVCQHGDTLTRKAPDTAEPLEEQKGALHFVGIDQQYFLSAVWPSAGAQDGRCVLKANSTERSSFLALPLTVPAGQRVTRSFGAFLGPKDIGLLLNIGKTSKPPSQGPGLDQTVDFGWLAVICKALIVFLGFFHSIAGNWGVAIILLTVMVKVVLMPLTHKAMVSAEQMKKLQPRMEEIRKKFPEDREKQNAEMMRLYQESKVNPLGGCLPLLLQFPIWAALYTTLRTSYELYGAPFWGVWSDLTSKDPTYLLPLALGVTMIVTQRLQPQMMDKSQAFMMTWVMPIFFTALMMNYPAGLALYIFTNNLLSIIQQYALRRYLASKGQLTPATPQKAGASR